MAWAKMYVLLLSQCPSWCCKKMPFNSDSWRQQHHQQEICPEGCPLFAEQEDPVLPATLGVLSGRKKLSSNALLLTASVLSNSTFSHLCGVKWAPCRGSYLKKWSRESPFSFPWRHQHPHIVVCANKIQQSANMPSKAGSLEAKNEWCLGHIPSSQFRMGSTGRKNGRGKGLETRKTVCIPQKGSKNDDLECW